MRSRLIRSVVCLGFLLGTMGLLSVDSAAYSVATRYHAARRTANFYRQATSTRVARHQVVAPVVKQHEKVDVSSRPAEPRQSPGDKAPVR